MDRAADASQIATVRIELADTEPLIWREVEVPTSISLKTLHAVIQAALGWENYHLWEFTVGKRRYGPPSDEDWRDEPLVDAGKVRLADLIGPRKTKIDYLYDFGDSWEHRLTVSGIRAADPNLSYPRYIRGERNGPPEDCGGIPGFYDKLEAVVDPRHPDHKEIKRWLRGYDPERIDEASIKHALGRIANQRRGGKAGAGKKETGLA